MRHPSHLLLKASSTQDCSRFQILEDERQKPRVGDAFPQPSHQLLVINRVEERLQIAIYYVALPPFSDPFIAHLVDGAVSTPSRSEPVRVITESRVI